MDSSNENSTSKQKPLSPMALGVMILIVIAIAGAVWYANRSDFKEPETRQAANEFLDKAAELEQSLAQVNARLEARSKTITVWYEFGKNKDFEAALEAVQNIRAEMGEAYGEGSVRALADWEGIKAAFDDAEKRLKAEEEEESATALEKLIVVLAL